MLFERRSPPPSPPRVALRRVARLLARIAGIILALQLAGCDVAGTGSIQVGSTPSGAHIFLDEIDSGLTTPAVLKDVASGFHTVRMSLESITDWGPKTVEVLRGTTVAVAGVLLYPGGLVFLPQEQYKTLPTLSPSTAPEELPAAVDLTASFPSPGDQGTQPSCVGWAVGYGLKSCQEAIEHRWSLESDSHLMSPAFIYNQIREPSGGALIYKALELVMAEGVASLATMPYDALSAEAKPTKKAHAEALQYRIQRWAPVNQGSTCEIKGFLATRVPVVAGIRVFPDFRDLDRDNPIYDSDSGRWMMDHAVVIVGYDDSRAAFKVLNSWGPSWGIDGYGWIAYDLALSVIQEAYVAVNRIAPTPPGPAANPKPSNGTTGVPVKVDLTWADGGGATSFDVYFGTNPTPDDREYLGRRSETSFGPGTLRHSTTYYWRIDARNIAGTTVGSVWSFTTDREEKEHGNR